MFFYTGKSPETGKELKKEFENLNEAEDFASDNSDRYPKYEIYNDKTDEIEASDEDDADAEATAMDNMFPDGEESEEGYNWAGDDE